MEPIDTAYERFEELLLQINTYRDKLSTEADTRLKVIDPIFHHVLLWPLGQIQAEPPTLTGFIDYLCQIDGRSRLVVEAKKDSRPLGCENCHAKRGYKLSGAVFKSEAAHEGIAQAIRYCGEKNAELACVTNGREWIIFRGNRLGDGLDTRGGMAFVFSDLETIRNNFAQFYYLLSYESVKTYTYRPYFREIESQPIRISAFHKSLRPPGSAKFLRSSQLSNDIGSVMARFFDRLTGDDDEDLLNACFVETRESQFADRQLARISEDLLRTVRDLETADADELTRLIRRATEAHRHEFVVIIGTKGAGKSTFITRFFKTVLPPDIAKHLVVVKVDMKGSTGNRQTIVSWLDDVLLAQTEAAVFRNGPPTYDQLRGIYFDEYNRLRVGTWATQYENDREGFRQRFGVWMEDQRQHRPHEYIEGMLRFIVRSEGKVPVIIFDNADHFEIDFQQSVYQYARSLYEETICLILLPITDRTSWQLSKHGALQSFDHQSLFLPTPSTEVVIRKRIEFLEERIEAERSRPGRYFLDRGIALSISDLDNFARTLQRVFLQTSAISEMIGSLANYDVRRSLLLAREFALSPHLKLEDLIKSYIADSSIEIPRYTAVRALVRGSYDIYPVGQHNYVQNIFALVPEVATTPLLGLRILQLLSDVPADEREGALIHVEQIVTYIADIGVEPRAVVICLDAMLRTGLCLSYDRTVQRIADTSQIEISPAGRQHLFWGLSTYQYLNAMAEVTPFVDEAAYRRLIDDERDHRGWRVKTANFLEYLIAEDALYSVVPVHASYESQIRLRRTIEGCIYRLRQPVPGRPNTARAREVLWTSEAAQDVGG